MAPRPIDNILGRLNQSLEGKPSAENLSAYMKPFMEEFRKQFDDAWKMSITNPALAARIPGMTDLDDTLKKLNENLNAGRQVPVTEIVQHMVELRKLMGAQPQGTNPLMNLDPRKRQETLDALNPLSATPLANSAHVRNATGALQEGDIITAIASLQELSGTAAGSINEVSEAITRLTTTATKTVEDTTRSTSLIGNALGAVLPGMNGGASNADNLRKIASLIPGEGLIGGTVRNLIMGASANPAMAAVAGPLGVAATAGVAARQFYVGQEGYRRQIQSSMGETGFGTSMGYDLESRVMALSPMISHGQARQIIGGVIQEGYEGHTADDAIGFATRNFNKWGMESSRSMELYRTLVDRAGLSTANVSNQLDVLADTASKTSSSMHDLTEQYLNTSQALTAQGLGETAPAAADMWTNLTAGIPALKGIDIAGMINSPIFMQKYSQQTGVPFSNVLSNMRNDPQGALPAMLESARSMLLSSNLGFREGMSVDDVANMKNLNLMAPVLQSMGMGFLQTPEQIAEFAGLMLDVDEKTGLSKPEEQLQRMRDRYKPTELGQDDLGAIKARAQSKGGGDAYEQYQLKYRETMPLYEKLLQTQGNNMRDTGVVLPDGSAVAWNDWIKDADADDLKALADGKLNIIDMEQTRAVLAEAGISGTTDDRLTERKGADFKFGDDGRLNQGEVQVALENDMVGSLADAVDRATSAVTGQTIKSEVLVDLTDRAMEWLNAKENPDRSRQEGADRDRETGDGDTTDNPRYNHAGRNGRNGYRG